MKLDLGDGQTRRGDGDGRKHFTRSRYVREQGQLGVARQALTHWPRFPFLDRYSDVSSSASDATTTAMSPRASRMGQL
ncbi:hypothetical protein MRB53_038034 [Persea americana]|nr:hypothetical protein MRB53_038034 [Persea americana]